MPSATASVTDWASKRALSATRTLSSYLQLPKLPVYLRQKSNNPSVYRVHIVPIWLDIAILMSMIAALVARFSDSALP
ncbi:hypothetical protein BBNG_01091 [Bifidobacterium bifidum NCIMB 41171]|nr:hypothetical protein BBNG_01091 [Bifidobacterium bifidum NCIMB 41171]